MVVNIITKKRLFNAFQEDIFNILRAIIYDIILRVIMSVLEP